MATANPKGVILHDETGVLKAVIPDVIEVREGDDVEWVVLPSNLQVTVAFLADASPFSWNKRGGSNIAGTIIAEGSKDGTIYKYTVTDEKLNTIDPHVRVKK